MSDHPTLESLRGPEGLPPGSRQAFLGHVAGCARCRRVWAEGDPTRLFALLSTREPDTDLLDQVSTGVMARLDREEWTRDRRFMAGHRGLRAVAAVAAGLVLVAGIFFVSKLDRGTGPQLAGGSRDAGPDRPDVLVSSPGEAELMELTVGDVQLVMIFDESLDL